MPQILLRSYLENPDFEAILHQIYEAVCANDLVKHYFVLVKKSAVVPDLRRYWPYLAPKPAMEYRRPPSPTASVDIQLPESQFAEVVQTMARVFREWKMNPEHVPQLSHEILELLEESRSQTNDTLSSKLEAKEVSADKLQYFLKRYKIATEVMPSKALMAERGLAHKLWLKVDPEQQVVGIIGRILISDAAFNDQIDEIIERQTGRESSVRLTLEQDDAGRRLLLTRHRLPYRYGIPMRLFVRYLRRIAMDLDQVHVSDKDGILQAA